MDYKRTCEICGRLYKVPDVSSFVQIKIVSKDTRSFGEYKICPLCAKQIQKHIINMKIDAPKKCEFCEHDYGPKHPEYRKNCEGCSKYSKFQLRTRPMGQFMQYRWDLYNGEVDV